MRKERRLFTFQMFKDFCNQKYECYYGISCKKLVELRLRIGSEYLWKKELCCQKNCPVWKRAEKDEWPSYYDLKKDIKNIKQV